MALQVPRYDEPQIGERPLPTVRQNASDYTQGARQLGEVAQVVGQAGDLAARNAERLQDQTDADTLFRTEAAAVADYQASFETPSRGRRGHKALGLGKEAGEWWDKAGAKYTEALTTDRQRRLFGNKLLQLRERSVGSWSTFEAEQRRASLRDSTEAGIVADINLAAASPGDQKILDDSRKSIRQRVAILGDLDGMDDTAREGMQQARLTVLHANVLDGLIDKNPAAAKAYFEANKGEIEGSKHAEIEAKLKGGTLRTLAQTAADELAGAGLSESEALAKARKQYSGDEEAAVVAEVKTRFTEREQARNESEKVTADQAWKVYADGGYQKNAIPNSLWGRLDGRTKIAIDADYAGRLAGTDVKTDWGVYEKLREMARDQPDQFLREDLRKYAPSLGTEARKYFEDRKDQIAKGNDVATLEQQLATAYKQMDWGKDDNEKKGQLDIAVRRAIREEQAANNGKPLNDEARQKIVDRMLLQSGSWFGGRFYETYGSGKEGEFDPEIPGAERAKIEAALARAGKPITEAEVVRLFKRKHGLP